MTFRPLQIFFEGYGALASLEYCLEQSGDKKSMEIDVHSTKIVEKVFSCVENHVEEF